MTVISLWTKHRRIARGIATEYSFPGADSDDVLQEAMIGLWVAATTFDPEKGPFAAWARLVIHRRLTVILRNATRYKNMVLSDAMREIKMTDEKISVVESVAGGREPFEILWERMEIERIRRGISSFTPLEARALADTLNGVAQDGQTDNAVWRARRKLRAAA